MAFAALSGCTDREIFDAVPDSTRSTGTSGTWPVLSPVAAFEARETGNRKAGENVQREASILEARARRLRARAAAMRGQVLSDRERQELLDALEDV